MGADRKARSTAAVTTYSYVGNLGCLRFPPPVRKASGIKRGDRLAVIVQEDGSVLLEKLEVPRTVTMASASDAPAEVAGCACESPPEACSRGQADLVTVGWSYVQLEQSLATRLGLLPDTPVKLVAEPLQIVVSRHGNAEDLKDVPFVACPP